MAGAAALTDELLPFTNLRNRSLLVADAPTTADSNIKTMNGPDILARTMSIPRQRGKNAAAWQYHPRSDHHSKVACWGILFDLLQNSPQLREHVFDGTVAFGINHVMTNFVNGNQKALDLVVCRPAPNPAGPTTKRKRARRSKSFRTLVDTYKIALSPQEQAILEELPDPHVMKVGSVLIALEAKAAMTEFAKARPRLYSELQDSHVAVHADTNDAIAVGFAMINASPSFVSPTANPCIAWGAPRKITSHQQPRELGLTIAHVGSLPRRANTDVPGFDAICALAVECENDGNSPVRIFTEAPAPQPGSVLYYDVMISRIVGLYASHFPAG